METLKEDHNATKDMTQIRRFMYVSWAIAVFCFLGAVASIVFLGPKMHGEQVRDYHYLVGAFSLSSLSLIFLTSLNQKRLSEKLAWIILAIEGLVVFWFAFVGMGITSGLVEQERLNPFVGNLIFLGPHIVMAGVLVLQTPWVRAFTRLKHNTAELDTDNPWLRYYPILAQIMVRVMNADGSISNKELDHFNAAMDEWHLAELQKRFLRDYCEESTTPLPELVEQAINLGRSFGQPDPVQALLSRLEAAAAVDGPINSDERMFLELVERSIHRITSQTPEKNDSSRQATI